MDIRSYTDYRKFLKSKLEQRLKSNPRYSLRAFAKSLELSPSRVSEILNGKQGLSLARAKTIGEKLGLTPSEIEYFADLVGSIHERSAKKREEAKERLRKDMESSPPKVLAIDAFQAISDWHHLAILELVKLRDFEYSVTWISQRLNLPPKQVELALERLERLGLIKYSEDGQLELCQDSGKIPDDIPSESIKNFHDQILSKARQQLFTQNIDSREYGVELFNIQEGRISEAKQELREFRQRFCQKFEARSKEQSENVYCMALQFFSLLEEK